MELAFNKILKEEMGLILPFIQHLSARQISTEVLEQRFSEMFEQNYECHGIYWNGELIGVFGLWFMTRARERGCETSELNTYVNNHRSHKFYLNEGYVIKGYHFLKKL